MATKIEIPFSSPMPILAVGAELKNTVCLLEGTTAMVGSARGALTEATAFREFTGQLDRERALLAGRAYAVAHDLHPGFLSTQYARGCNGRRIAVQHHHAHMVACMAEHGVMQPVIGISCDGTGYGTDGAVWGGEILRATPTDFTREAHLAYFPQPGGDAAARETWRPALSLAHQTFGSALPEEVRALFEDVEPTRLATCEAMLRADFNCPRTSSLGRLFDAVAFLAGCGERNDTEGQAAIRLEQAVMDERAEPYPFSLERTDTHTEIVLDKMMAAICKDACDRERRDLIASRFHETVATMLSDAAWQVAEMYHISIAVLTGGCFFNRVLTRRVRDLLRERGLARVLIHSRLSPGDENVSLGQAVVAAARLGGCT